MHNDFDDFATDSITIVKTDGQKFEGLKASVQRDRIFFWNSSILVEPKDLIQRNMSNGGVETYEVIDPNFIEKIMDFSAHYQMRVRKLGLPEVEKAFQTITYNINGVNARVNNNSVDNSTNLASMAPGVEELISKLRADIQSIPLSIEEKQEVLELVDEIEAQAATGKPKKGVTKSLIAALPAVESVTAIAASLSTLLQL